MSFTETNFENAVLELIQSLGYTRLYGPDIPRDYRTTATRSTKPTSSRPSKKSTPKNPRQPSPKP